MMGNRRFRVRDMVEKPKINPPSHFAIIGRYILPPDIFPLLEKTERGSGGDGPGPTPGHPPRNFSPHLFIRTYERLSDNLSLPGVLFLTISDLVG